MELWKAKIPFSQKCNNIRSVSKVPLNLGKTVKQLYIVVSNIFCHVIILGGCKTFLDGET